MSGVDLGPTADLPLAVKKVLVSLDEPGGRCLVVAADGHRAAWKASAPPTFPVAGLTVELLPAEGAEWWCDACNRELDRSCPIPVEDGWALCRECARRWGFPSGWRRRWGSVRLCQCVPCATAAEGLTRSERRGLLLLAGRLLPTPPTGAPNRHGG